MNSYKRIRTPNRAITRSAKRALNYPMTTVTMLNMTKRIMRGA